MTNKTLPLALLLLVSYCTSITGKTTSLQDLPRILIAQGSGEVVEHTGYTLSYSEAHEQAEWVAYTVSVNEINTDVARTDNFREDPKVSPRDQPHLLTIKALDMIVGILLQRLI